MQKFIEQGAMGEYAKTLINDGRLAARILVNEKIRELMNTVISALEQSNNEKLEKLSEIAKDPNLVRKILKRPDIAEFVDILFDHSLINSCESFILTPPFKIKTRDLDIKTFSGNLEILVKQIRQNVLQLSSQNVWGRLKSEVDLDIILQPKSSSSSVSKSKMDSKPTTDNTSRTSKFDMPSKKPPPRKLSEEEIGLDRSSINFIARNIAAASKVKRIEYDFEEEEIIPSKRSSIDSTRSKRRSSADFPALTKANIQSFLPPVTETLEEEIKMEQEKIESPANEALNESSSISSEDRPSKKKSVHSHESKYHIKQTTCPACMEKWKTPLPAPKTPRVKKSIVLGETGYPLLKTNSQNRVSMLISKEMYKLQSYDRKYSIENESKRVPIIRKKENDPDRVEVVHLNPMDLAKIEQEIKEKETQKKLEKFLKEIA